jgi:biotin carboxyl carrier protein
MVLSRRPERILEAEVDGQAACIGVREQAEDRFHVTVQGRKLDVDTRLVRPGFLSLLIDGRSYLAGFERLPAGYVVTIGHATFVISLAEPTGTRSALSAPRAAAGPARLKAPMPGKIVRVLVELGANVAAAQGLVVMEAMKMENELKSPRVGRVLELHVREGETVEAGQPIAVIE